MSISRFKTSAIALLLAIGLVLPSNFVAAAGQSLDPVGSPVSLRSDLGSGRPVQAKTNKSGKGDHGKPDKGKGKKEKPGKQKVNPITSNAVDVVCTSDMTAAESTCSFTATGPNGPSKIKTLYVPEAIACSAVIDTTGSGATIEGDPAFSSRKNKPDLTIVLDGVVSEGGTATYWVEAGKQLVPVAGQGLICTAAATAVPATATAMPATSETQSAPTAAVPVTSTPDPTPDDASAAGTIELRARTCVDAMTETDADWFRGCPNGAAGLQFHLALINTDNSGLAAVTDANGMVTFDNLQPGTYQLNLVDSDWCHAESDSVNDSGDLVVGGGADVTVWIFTCAGT